MSNTQLGKKTFILLLCITLLLVPFHGGSLAEEGELSEFWVYDKEDLSFLSIAATEYLVYHGSDSITYRFSKKLVDKYTADELVRMTKRAVNMASMENYTCKYSTRSDGTLRVKISGMKIRSGEKMLEAWLFGDRSSLTTEESRCLDQVIQVMNGLMRKYPETSLELETAIFDYICDHVSYQNYPSGSEKREACTSASNAWMKGWGNCQAYSDLFRLMATIGGFSTGLVSGYAKGDSHMWNWIGTWFGGTYRVYMVDVTYGDYDGRRHTDHFWMNFGLDRVDSHVWYKEICLFDEFESYTNDSCTYYNGTTGFTANTIDQAAQICASRTKGGQNKMDFLVLQNGIWEEEISAALRKYIRQWHYDCYRHDAGVSVVFWR